MYPGKQSNDETLSVPLPLLVAQKWKCHAGPTQDCFPGCISCWAPGSVDRC